MSLRKQSNKRDTAIQTKFSRSSKDFLSNHLAAEKRKKENLKLMDSQAQLQRTHGHHQAEEPIRIHHPEEEEHHEKGPAKVLKKAKVKAKKIKKALTKHGHDHGEHIPDEDQKLHGGAPARARGHHISDTVREEFFPDPMKEEIVPPGKKFIPVVSSSHIKPSGHESRVEGDEAPSSGYGYGNKVISLATPVHEKVKGTGACVMTKLPFSRGVTGTENQQGQDKGISAKEYLREKLSPGQEDKALSEVVAEKLHLGGDTAAREKKGQ